MSTESISTRNSTLHSLTIIILVLMFALSYCFWLSCPYQHNVTTMNYGCWHQPHHTLTELFTVPTTPKNDILIWPLDVKHLYLVSITVDTFISNNTEVEQYLNESIESTFRVHYNFKSSSLSHALDFLFYHLNYRHCCRNVLFLSSNYRPHHADVSIRALFGEKWDI